MQFGEYSFCFNDHVDLGDITNLQYYCRFCENKKTTVEFHQLGWGKKPRHLSALQAQGVFEQTLESPSASSSRVPS